MNNPKVSIILTSYNHAKYLRESIESVLNQTYKDFELIIWDDASTDDSWDIIQSYKDSRIKSFRNTENKRASANFNEAVSKVARGEFIAIHTSDDAWESEKLEKQVKFLENQPDFGGVFSLAEIIDEDGNTFKDENHFYSKIFEQPNRNRYEWLNFFFMKGNALCDPSALVRKKCYEECELYRYGLAQIDDLDFWIRLCMKFDIHIIQEKLVRFRIRNNELNISGNRPETRARLEFEYLQIYEYYRKIQTKEEFLRIFPSVHNLLEKADYDQDIVLGLLSIREDASKSSLLFGLKLLFEALNDPVRRKKLKESYSILNNDFLKISAHYDVFSTDKVYSLSQKLSDQKTQVRELEIKINELENEMMSLQREYDGGTQKLQSELEALQNEMISLQREYDGGTQKLQSELEALQNEMMSHQREYDIGIHKQQSALEALQNEIAARQAKLEALQGGISSLENLTRTQTERIVWLQQELRTIHGSKTWKVLCLLRKLKNRVLPPESTSAVIGKRAVNKVLSSAHTVTRKMRQNRDIALINKSGLFDREWYLTTYPDIANSQVDPLTHYLFFGAFEGRDPGPDFSSSYYFRSNVDVRVVETNPLMHYLKFGKNEGRRPKPGAGDMPVNHTAVMTEPSPAVEVNSLANTQGQVKAQNQADTGLPGLEIYASQTTNLTGRMTQPNEKSGIVSAPSDQTQRVELLKSSFEKMLETASGIRMDDYVPYRENEAINAQDTVKLITFYLPQFHPIPENDLWWGKGFTEWTNVSKAVPQFYGHYQPRLPGELGFYDLRLPEVQARQVELARNYGIHGFCFYHYWFGGKRLLDKPLDMFVNNPNIDFPFCICWANENWTRRWDGKEDDVLMQQQHSLDNDIYFIHELLPYLENERYIRIDGRPLIIVYRTSLLKNASATAKAWRKFCLEKGLGDPYLVAAQTFGFNDPQPIGFDAAVEFPPHNIVYTNIIDRVHLLNNNYQGAVYSYIEMVSKNIEPLVDHPYRVFRTACPSWDNEPRKPGRGNSFIGSNPELYSHWVKKLAFAEMASHDENSRFVFVNSWNEWGEGANLEPDRKFGYAYLQATHDALANCSPPDLFNINGKINLSSLRMNYETAVLLHVFYPDLLEEMKSYLDHIGDYDLYISIPESEEELDKEIFKVFPDAFVFRVLNRGRDIAPFISMLDLINLLGYPYFLKLHTKKSQHRADGDFWRRDILQKLTGSPECVNLIKQTLKRNKNIGIVGPKGHVLSSQVYWGFNKNKTIELASRVGLALDENPTFEFVAGTMFWAKPQAFNLFSMLPICLDEFEPEPIAKDGALVHSLERFIGISAQETGCRIWEIGEDGVITDPRLNLDRFFPFAVQT